MRIFYYLYTLIFAKNRKNMDKQQIYRLQKLGINTDNCTIDIFEDLLNIAEHLFEELEIREEDRFKTELYRLKNPTN